MSVAPGLVIVDKPAGMTSHDVVGRCRRAFGTRKVGHAGTLDPMATGVLVVGVERATKILGLLTLADKSYAATVRLGQTTTTDDAEGEVTQTAPAGHLGDQDIVAAVARWRGEVEQVPSAVSAIKVGGQRAYALARAGRPVELAARRVRIHRFEVLAVRRAVGVDGVVDVDGVDGVVDVDGVDGVVDVDVEVDCTSGTYVRALARDVGDALGVGGHLTALRRTRVGDFGIDRAHTLEQLADQPRLTLTLDDACLLAFPRCDLSDTDVESARHGRSLAAAGLPGTYAAVAPTGEVIALLRDEGQRTRSVVVIRPATL